MEIVTIEKIKESLKKNSPAMNCITLTNHYLMDKNGKQLYTGDIIEFKSVIAGTYHGVIMFGKYACWVFGTLCEFIGFYILPILGIKEIPINLDINNQLINCETEYIGNIYDKQCEILFKKEKKNE